MVYCTSFRDEGIKIEGAFARLQFMIVNVALYDINSEPLSPKALSLKP